MEFHIIVKSLFVVKGDFKILLTYMECDFTFLLWFYFLNYLHRWDSTGETFYNYEKYLWITILYGFFQLKSLFLKSHFFYIYIRDWLIVWFNLYFYLDKTFMFGIFLEIMGYFVKILHFKFSASEIFIAPQANCWLSWCDSRVHPMRAGTRFEGFLLLLVASPESVSEETY